MIPPLIILSLRYNCIYSSSADTDNAFSSSDSESDENESIQPTELVKTPTCNGRIVLPRTEILTPSKIPLTTIHISQ